MRISVIMPVYLGGYEVDGIKSASDPEYKFRRAVLSFQMQSFKDTELIIVSDGSELAEKIYNEYFITDPQIKFISISKQSLFSGVVRQTGIEKSKGEIICYLDHDDVIGTDHLKMINEGFTGHWVHYNDFLIRNKELTECTERQVRPELFYIGTSSIAHLRSLNVVWGDGYAHDWRMIEKYLLPYPTKKIHSQYYVCHFHPNDF